MKMILATAVIVMAGSGVNALTYGSGCSHGDFVGSDCALSVYDPSGSLVSLTVTGAGGTPPGNVPQIFDSSVTGSADEDLQSPPPSIKWTMVPEAGSTKGNPNDDSNGGTATYEFVSGLSSSFLKSFIYIDADQGGNPPWTLTVNYAEGGSDQTNVGLTGEGGVGTIDFSSFVTSGFTLDTLVIDQGGDSGGWAVSVVPVPASVLMLAAGMGLFGAARRMKARGIA